MGKFSCFQENKIPQFGKIWEYRGQDFGASLPVFGNYWENAGKYGVILGKYGIIFSQKIAIFNCVIDEARSYQKIYIDTRSLVGVFNPNLN